MSRWPLVKNGTGLANSIGALRKYLMAQAADVLLERFAQPVRMYKAPPAHALTEEFYETGSDLRKSHH